MQCAAAVDTGAMEDNGNIIKNRAILAILLSLKSVGAIKVFGLRVGNVMVLGQDIKYGFEKRELEYQKI